MGPVSAALISVPTKALPVHYTLTPYELLMNDTRSNRYGRWRGAEAAARFQVKLPNIVWTQTRTGVFLNQYYGSNDLNEHPVNKIFDIFTVSMTLVT